MKTQILFISMTKKENETSFIENIKTRWPNLGLKNYDIKRPITREELAVLVDATLNPFDVEIGFDGQLKK